VESHFSKASRVIAVLIVAVFFFSALTSIVPGTQPVQNASAAAVTEVNVGWMSQIQNWNPMNIDMVEDYVASYLMFSCLFQYDEDNKEVVNDLATGYTQVVNPNGTMTTTIDITSHAFFRNAQDLGSTAHQLTASDVKYTFDRIIANTGGAWDVYLYNVSSIQVISPTQLTILTDFPKATLITDLLGIPIIPQYKWVSIADNKFLAQMKPGDLVGSGPFVYTDSTNTWFRFTVAPNYHGATDYPGVRDVNIGSILYTVYGDPGGMVLDMNSGVLDTIVLSGQPDLYRNTLGGSSAKVNVFKSAVQENGICDIAVNAIPVEFRSTTGGGFGQGNPLLLDPVVRKAIMMTLNKTDIVEELMFGMVTRAESVIMPGPWQKDITPTVFDTAAAKALLQANYYWDTDGDGWLEANSTAFPVRMGWATAGAELNFRLHAPNNEPSYMAVGQSWDRWAAEAGINFQYQALQESVMNNADWYKADYDVWVWHWGWGPEPLSDLSVWLTNQIKPSGDNCQMPMGPWYYNAANSSTGKAYSAFDENWTLATKTMNVPTREGIVDNLQQMIYDSYTENPPFYDLGLYGYTDQRFVGWGDWVTHPGRTVASDLLWVWFDLQPVDNQSPMFDAGLNPSYSPMVGTLQTFQVQVHDVNDDKLWVNWTFGDGSPVVSQIVPAGTTAIPKTLTQSHTYTVLNPDPGYTMTVTLTDGVTGHTNKLTTTTVYVVESPDRPPSFTSLVASSPASPVYNDTVVTWFVNASDAESGGQTGFGLRFTWDWGDGTFTVSNHHPTVNNVAVMDTATHSWSTAGTYNVRVWVWDGNPNLIAHNVSSGIAPELVIENTPPSAPTPSITGTEGTWIECVATSVDADSDGLRFTWEWDDGTFNVTNHAPSASQVTSTAFHRWPVTGAPATYPVTVYVDDRTGYTGHNVSVTIDASISAVGANVPPSALQLTLPSLPWYVDTDLTFSTSAIDTDGDALEFYFEFGDGAADGTTFPAGVTTRQYADFTHSYAAAGTYTVTLWVNDSTGPASHNSTRTESIDVVANEVPWVQLPSILAAGYNRTFTVTPTQCRDNDSDPLQVWYDWGDGKPMTQGGSESASYAGTHIYSSLGNKTLTIYADDGTGLPGHNVSATETVKVSEANLKPEIVGVIERAPSKTVYEPNETITFSIVVRDFEGDNMTLTVEFGDGVSQVVAISGATVDPANAANGNITKNVTHAFAAARIDLYRVNATVEDDMDHSDENWSVGTTSVKVTAPAPPSSPNGGGISLALVGGIAIVAIIAIVAVLLLLKRKKKDDGSTPSTAPGGMEGMAPPPS
jgi:ABC-type transport system substrate-binding protein